MPVLHRTDQYAHFNFLNAPDRSISSSQLLSPDTTDSSLIKRLVVNSEPLYIVMIIAVSDMMEDSETFAVH